MRELLLGGVWLTTGLSPLAQVREGGTLAAFVMWPTVGLAFTPIHVLGAFVEGGAEARVAVAAITGCPAVLRVLALHRGRAHEHTLVQARYSRHITGVVRHSCRVRDAAQPGHRVPNATGAGGPRDGSGV